MNDPVRIVRQLVDPAVLFWPLLVKCFIRAVLKFLPGQHVLQPSQIAIRTVVNLGHGRVVTLAFASAFMRMQNIFRRTYLGIQIAKSFHVCLRLLMPSSEPSGKTLPARIEDCSVFRLQLFTSRGADVINLFIFDIFGKPNRVVRVRVRRRIVRIQRLEADLRSIVQIASDLRNPPATRTPNHGPTYHARPNLLKCIVTAHLLNFGPERDV